MNVKGLILAAVAATLVAASCTRVQMSEPVSSHSSIVCSFNSTLPAGCPSQFKLMYARKSYSLHDSITVKTNMTDTVKVYAGDWYGVVYSYGASTAYDIQNGDEFISAPDDAGIIDLYAKLKEYKPEDDASIDATLKSLFKSLSPLAPEDFRVVEQAAPLWVASDSRAFAFNGGAVDSLRLRPRDLSQRITVNLKVVSADPALTVERVAVSLIGVPLRARIMDGGIHPTEFGRALSEMTEDPANPGNYSATLGTLGLMGPETTSDTYGAGVLEVAIKISEREQPVTSRINLARYIGMFGYMQPLSADIPELLQKASDSELIDIASKLTLTVSKQDPSGDSEPLAYWEAPSENEIPVIPEEPGDED